MFIINKNQYLKFNIDQIDPDDDLIWKEFSIDFINNKKNIKTEIGLSTIADFCSQLIAPSFTQKLLNNELPIDKIITKDLGRIYNQLHTKKEYKETHKHFFISNVPRGKEPKVHSWMYNDEKGRIILQVGLAFEWEPHYRKNGKELKKFLEEYSAFEIVIPKYRLKQLVKQAREIEKQLQDGKIL
jgi:hypothetical protein